jgi:hypothetical protein
MNFKLFLLSVAAMVNAAYGETPLRVELGTAADFAILAKAGITNVADSVITGDMGVSPIAATSMTGFGLIMDNSNEFSTSSQVANGSIYAPGYVGGTPSKLTTAVSDMLIAYNYAAAVAVTSIDPVRPEYLYINHGKPAVVVDNVEISPAFPGELGGETLTAGVYEFGLDVTITDEDLTFKGSATDIFIIKTTKSVKQAANTNVILDGALAKNIFWQVAETFEVGASAKMKGTLLVKTAVTFITGSELEGRILSQTLVALQMATITTEPATSRRGLRGLQLA